jgi:hypothetical protein
MRLFPALLGAVALLWSSASLAATDPNQQNFMLGVGAISRGDYKAAIGILEPLAALTGQARVRLEFARALYFDKQYKRARAEFMTVYYMKDLPYAVRRTINVFLADIDQKAGFIQPRAGIAYDTNPGKAAASGTYDIFGIPLQLERQSGLDAIGLSYGADFAAPLGLPDFSLVGDLDGAAYRIAGASDVSANAAVRLSDPGLKGWSELGTAVYWRDRNVSIYTVYADRTRRFALAGGRELTVTAEIARNEVTPLADYDGFTLQGSADYAFDLGRNTAVDIGASGSRSTARIAVDERWEGAVRAAVIQALPRLNKNLILSGGEDVTRYDAPDPFFGTNREDRILHAELTLLNGAPIHGLFPGVSLSYERDDCNIPFYGYERRAVLFQLRRRF